MSRLSKTFEDIDQCNPHLNRYYEEPEIRHKLVMQVLDMMIEVNTAWLSLNLLIIGTTFGLVNLADIKTRNATRWH